MLKVFAFLHRYDHEIHVFFDTSKGHPGDQRFNDGRVMIAEGVQYLKNIAKVEAVIVPPVYELDSNDSGIVPLFKTYLFEHCLTHSLIGKLGFIGDSADCEAIEKLLKSIQAEYSLTVNQLKTKKFNRPFATWVKSLPLVKYFVSELSSTSHIVAKYLKAQLRYFKDAAVDTLVPLNYGYFHYQKSISNSFNPKKTRFHRIDSLEESFLKAIHPLGKPSSYGVTVHSKGNIDSFTSSKKRVRLLQRGKQVKISYIPIV